MKTKQNTTIDNSFKEVQPISGGNAFELDVRLKTQNNINNTINAFDAAGVNSAINMSVEQFLKRTVAPWWIMLQEQANYFCNQFQWNTKDWKFKRLVINVIRAAFYSGCAGIYYNSISEEFEAVVLGEMNFDAGGNLVDAKYTLANNYLSGIKDSPNGEFKCVYNIPPHLIENLAYFKWGTEGWSAWIRILPYVNLDHMLMEMITTQSFSYLKKFVYVANDPSVAKTEMEAFFNTKNPFIIRSGFSSESLNRFEELNNSTGGSLELLEFYRQVMSIIARKIGRRENVDIKPERNVSNEVDASQENYDIVFNDTNKQFHIFVESLNEIVTKYNKGSKIELYLDDYIDDSKEDLNMNGEKDDISTMTKSDNR